MRIEQQDIVEDVEVKVEGDQMVLTGRLCFSLPLPQQDVPNELESEVNRVEKWNDWAVADRCKRRGMSWAPLGVLSLALLQAARRNKELDTWRKEGALPLWTVPTPSAQAA